MKIGYRTMERQNTNKSLDVYYRRSLQNLYNAFVQASLKLLKKHYAVVKTSNAGRSVAKVGSSFNQIKSQQLDLFMEKSEKLIVKYIKRLSGSSQKDFKAKYARFFGNTRKLAIQYNHARYDELLKTFIKRNMSVVEGLCQRTVDRVENIVYNAMTTGTGWEDITIQLDKQTKMGERHITEIARDQTAKATEEINMFMQISAGVKYFEWSTSKDERVSTGPGGHDVLDGKIFKYGDDMGHLPVIDPKGNRGYPAQRVNCRCTGLAVFIEDGFTALWDKKKQCYVIKPAHWTD